MTPTFKRADAEGTEWALDVTSDGRARLQCGDGGVTLDRGMLFWLCVVAGPALLPYLEAGGDA